MTDREKAITEFAVEMTNAAVLVGSTVIYIHDDGTRTEEKTRSQAWVLPSGHGVIQLVGKSGSVSLERIRITANNIEEARRHAVSPN